MIQIFIIFHKNIFDDCYKNIPADVLYKYFTFVAVNKNIPKQYTKNKYKIINEWELPIYNNIFQERGYNENSAIYHIYINNLHKEYNYIGFFQYDMIFKDNIIDYLYKNIEDIKNTECTEIIENNTIYFPLELYDFNFCSYQTWNEPKTLDYVINDYEKFYNVKFSKNEKYPLFNTYIIPINIYEKIMKWIIQLYDKIYPWCMQYPNKTHFGHIGGIYERIMGYALGQEKMIYKNINVEHNHFYKNLSY
jgi:hypothetical protein